MDHHPVSRQQEDVGAIEVVSVAQVMSEYKAGAE
jgi:hypothetical protein